MWLSAAGYLATQFVKCSVNFCFCSIKLGGRVGSWDEGYRFMAPAQNEQILKCQSHLFNGADLVTLQRLVDLAFSCCELRSLRATRHKRNTLIPQDRMTRSVRVSDTTISDLSSSSV
ncbi:hypothetical protein EFK68_03720 [Pseudomonas aeruginosa]|nr:hypothetical protein EFK68_03720 [Pseudomonas aeruginosa]